MDRPVIHSLVTEYSSHSYGRKGFVMSEEQEYVAGLAGSEESPTTKRSKVRLKKRVTPPALPSHAPPPEKKKSQSRLVKEIAAGKAVPEQRKTKDGVKHVVEEEKAKEEDNDEDEEEEVEYDLEDDAIARKILKNAEKRFVVRKAAKKRKAGAPRKKTSVVHVMFEAVDEKPGSFRCRASGLACKTGHPTTVKQGGVGTSNLIQHARTWHLEVVEALVKASNEHKDVAAEFEGMLEAATPPSANQRTMDTFANTVKRSRTGFETQLALLVMIVGCSLPFSIIDSKHFKDWMAVLRLSLQSEGTIKKMLPPLYDSVCQEQEAFVRKCGFFSITFDLWTSVAKQKYLVATYHTMDDDFTMFSAPLDLIPMSCSAFGEFIALAIETRIEHHRFNDCVFMASFSDSGSNCKMAKGMLTPGDEEPCFHHTMKLMLDDVIGGAEGGGTNAVAATDLLSVGLLVAIVRSNAQLRTEISRAAEKIGIESLELIAANITRWEGRYSALKRFLELQTALVKVHAKRFFDPFILKAKANFPDDFLKESYFRRLSAYKDLLQRFHKISKAGQSQTEPTLSCVAHWVWSMEDFLMASEEDSSVVKSLKSDLLCSCRKRMLVFVAIEADDTGDIALLPNAIKAGLLDPRHSHEVQRRLSEKELHAVRDAIVADTVLLYRSEVLHKAIESAMEGAFEALMECLKKAETYHGSALAWWRELKSKHDEAVVFTHYFLAARVFLSMPAGGAPSESVFSGTTDMVTKKRNCLGDDTLEQMTIVRHFVRSPRYKFDVLAKKMAADTAKKQKRNAGVQARAAAQQDAMEEVEIDECE